MSSMRMRCWAAVLFVLASTSWAAETVVDDFDDGNLQSPGAAWRCSSFRLDLTKEKAKSGEYSLKVTYEKQGDGAKWDFIEIEPEDGNFSGHKALVLWVEGEVDLLLKLWDSQDRQEDVSIQSSKKAKGWTRLVFDLGGTSSVDKSAIKKILLFPEPGMTNCTGTIYLDTLAAVKD